MRDKSIFISYAHEDIDLARKIFDDLQNAGFDPWFDKISLLPGQKWRTEIKKAIRNCSLFVALLSSKSISKQGYVQKELKAAFEILDEIPELSSLSINRGFPQAKIYPDLLIALTRLYLHGSGGNKYDDNYFIEIGS